MTTNPIQPYEILSESTHIGTSSGGLTVGKDHKLELEIFMTIDTTHENYQDFLIELRKLTKKFGGNGLIKCMSGL